MSSVLHKYAQKSSHTISAHLPYYVCAKFCTRTHTRMHARMHAYTHSILFLYLYKYAWIIVTEEVVCFDWSGCQSGCFQYTFTGMQGLLQTVWLMRLSIWLFLVHIYRHAGTVTDSVANEVVYMAIFSTHLQACRGCYRVTVTNQLSNWLCFQFTCTSIQGLSHSVVLCVGSLSPTGRVNVFTCANTLGSDPTCKLLFAKFPCGLLVGKASAGWPLNNAAD